MIPLLQNRNILLGVTGSIAAYKAADLASKLAQAGALVDVVLTQSALQFIAPLTFQSLTGRRAYRDQDLWGSEGHIQHIGLGKKADILVIAPASANTIAKLAYGIANNLLTVTALAVEAPLVIAPAMDGGMYNHPATRHNLKILKDREAVIIGPVEGHLASGLVGIGRMAEPTDIIGEIRLILAQDGPLSGQHVIVTAGGTQEPIDPVRSINNRSSGKQGYAIAQAALDLGAKVTLISAPTALTAPVGVNLINIFTADEMKAAVMTTIPDSDMLIMAAAVADFRPITLAQEKIKRERGIPKIELEATDDILTEVSRQKAQTNNPRIVVGFAAESHNLLKHAQRKLKSKGLDLIVANDITAPDSGFAADTNQVVLIDANEKVTKLPLMSKEEVARKVMERVSDLSANFQ
ncbi:MAG: bifunctional phosphopantothenoylcysteine decarboxylase/phosphopantothenate--cysteine ligase CoaBC [Anaerolineales bacterium]|nr:bifunctional phosphopantothenoylcysteine decarboxylase/phosphopantothenate--cysteine ligase CoaBC [Anaerolineales bacterium]